jgi:hypothetical protein
MPSRIGVKVMSVEVTMDTRKGLKLSKLPSLFSVVVDTSDHRDIEGGGGIASSSSPNLGEKFPSSSK